MRTNAFESMILQYNLLNSFKNELKSYEKDHLTYKKIVYKFKIKILYVIIVFLYKTLKFEQIRV